MTWVGEREVSGIPEAAWLCGGVAGCRTYARACGRAGGVGAWRMKHTRKEGKVHARFWCWSGAAFGSQAVGCTAFFERCQSTISARRAGSRESEMWHQTPPCFQRQYGTLRATGSKRDPAAEPITICTYDASRLTQTSF